MPTHCRGCARVQCRTVVHAVPVPGFHTGMRVAGTLRDVSVFTFLPEHFQRVDDQPDTWFYDQPRFVQHIDDGAIAAIGHTYEQLVQQGDTVLDLMSSWVSHFLPGRWPRRLVGLGMNAQELGANPQLTGGWLQHDINRAGGLLPLADASFDAVTCAVSVQYLTQPLRTFTEVWRVLKPGGVAIFSFSNRCFPTKAVAIWRVTSDDQHVSVVAEYFQQSGDWGEIRGGRANPEAPGDPLYVVWARKEA